MKKKKVCWKITTKCNQKCKYCFGFSNIEELSFNDNKKVIDNLIKNGLTNITWTGGEAILYPRLNELIKLARGKNIYNKLVTNGIYIAQNDNLYVEDILNNLDEINLSIDSICNNINIELGKENNHFEIIKKVLEKTKDKSIRIGINTVITKSNINSLEELGEFLNNYKIDKWKFLKFMPVREKALRNKQLYEVNEKELKEKIAELRIFENIRIVEYKKQSEFEKSIVILPNADVIQTQNGNDIKLGNALTDEKINLKGISKIRVLVANNNINETNNIINTINELDFAEIVGMASTGEETYNKIVNLKPDMVFAKYNMDSVKSIDIIKKSKEELQSELPTFNLIADKYVSDTELKEVYTIINKNLNSLITDPTEEMITHIMQEYNEYIENK